MFGEANFTSIRLGAANWSTAMIGVVAVVGDVRRALAGRAGGRHGLKRRERGCAFAVAREFVDIDAGKSFSVVVRGWDD